MREGQPGPQEAKRGIGNKLKNLWLGSSTAENLDRQDRLEKQAKAAARQEQLVAEAESRKAQRQDNLQRDLDFWEKNDTPIENVKMLLRNSQYKIDEEGTPDNKTFTQWLARRQIDELATSKDADIIPLPKRKIEDDQEDAA